MRALAITLALVVAAVSTNAGTYEVHSPTVWWQNTTIYEVWIESFKDSDGNGMGDLPGVTSKLEHFVDMGIETLWLAPFYTSPMFDSGYDVANYKEVNSDYGTLDDFDALITRAHELGLRVIVDFVPNHVSDQHEWFLAAKNGTAPYVDYFVWNNGTLLENGTRVPPNNWVDMFNEGSTWMWVEERDAYVFHEFSKHQIDLNYRNPLVHQEMLDILTFWLEHGVDGFRVDAVPFLYEREDLKDEPLSNWGYEYPNYYYLNHLYTMDQPESFDVLTVWQELIDNYTQIANDGKVRTMFTEGYVNMSFILDTYDAGVDMPFNFRFINAGEIAHPAVVSTATDIVDIIETWMSQMPDDKTANWVFGNHDMNRVADRMGKKRVDAVNFMSYLLPGVPCTYYGDEMGVNGTYLTWAETTDVRACSTSEEVYQKYSRDPFRTPYRWDNTTSAGFSTNSTTFIKVDPDYLTVNLAAQKEADVSHYKNVQKAIALRNTKVINEGNLIIEVLEEDVVAFARTLDGCQPIMVLMNWSNDTEISVAVNDLVSDTKEYEVLIADIYSGISVGDKFSCSSVTLPANAAVVLRGIDTATETDESS